MDKKKRVIIISLDAVGKRDMEFMKTLPNFSAIIENGAFCDNVYSVYPSLTYPAHSSIVTGKMPNNHRITANTKLQPSRNKPDWLYKRKYINGTTIVDEAGKAGYKIASFLWPVMGGADIDWNIPEILITRKWQTQITACIANGSPLFLMDVNKRFGSIRHGVLQPDLDDFLMACVEYTIDKYDPDMMLIHLTDVDTNRHDFGTFGPEIEKALRRHDERIGKIKEWLSKKRPLDDTLFIVLGDHCQVDMHTIVYLNTFFKEKNLLTVSGDKVTDYKVIAKSCDGSTYLYLNPKYKDDENVIEQVMDAVNSLKADERLGIEEIYSSEEAAAMGADGNCLAMIEGKPGYYFLNNTDILTEAVKDTKNHKMLATHGCLPSKEGNITFFAMEGPGVKKQSRIGKMHLWDEGPTIAKLMGLSLPDADGRIIEEFME